MITAVILAAGESKRMGQPKMLLPWGKGTVISHVITNFRNAGLKDIIVVTGGARERLDEAISHFDVKAVYNDDFAKGDMLTSIQCAIEALPLRTKAMLIGLGDQPLVRAGTVQMICEAYEKTKSPIVVPSYQMRRGHPWLVAKTYWTELLNMKSPNSPRDFLRSHQKDIYYVYVDDMGILADLDTPEDYERWKPRFS